MSTDSHDAATRMENTPLLGRDLPHGTAGSTPFVILEHLFIVCSRPFRWFRRATVPSTPASATTVIVGDSPGDEWFQFVIEAGTGKSPEPTFLDNCLSVVRKAAAELSGEPDLVTPPSASIFRNVAGFTMLWTLLAISIYALDFVLDQPISAVRLTAQVSLFVSLCLVSLLVMRSNYSGHAAVQLAMVVNIVMWLLYVLSITALLTESDQATQSLAFLSVSTIASLVFLVYVVVLHMNLALALVLFFTVVAILAMAGVWLKQIPLMVLSTVVFLCPSVLWLHHEATRQNQVILPARKDGIDLKRALHELKNVVNNCVPFAEEALDLVDDPTSLIGLLCSGMSLDMKEAGRIVLALMAWFNPNSTQNTTPEKAVDLESFLNEITSSHKRTAIGRSIAFDLEVDDAVYKTLNAAFRLYECKTSTGATTIPEAFQEGSPAVFNQEALSAIIRNLLGNGIDFASAFKSQNPDVEARVCLEVGLINGFSIPDRNQGPILGTNLSASLPPVAVPSVKSKDQGAFLGECATRDSVVLQLVFYNTGRGIKLSDVSEGGPLFTPHGQTEEGRRRGGSGIGLTVVDENVVNMGGSLMVQSRINGFVSFVIEVPVKIGPNVWSSLDLDPKMITPPDTPPQGGSENTDSPHLCLPLSPQPRSRVSTGGTVETRDSALPRSIATTAESGQSLDVCHYGRTGAWARAAVAYAHDAPFVPRILLADDSNLVQRLAGAFFAKAGYDPTVVGTPETARELALSAPQSMEYDIIFLDNSYVHSPLTGIQLGYELRVALGRRPFIVLISGDDLKGLSPQTLAPFDRMFKKESSPRKFFDQLELAVNMAKLRHHVQSRLATAPTPNTSP